MEGKARVRVEARSSGRIRLSFDLAAGRTREATFHSASSIGIYVNITGLCCGANIFAQIESGDWDGPLRDPAAHLIALGNLSGKLRLVSRLRKFGEGLAGRDQRPTLRIVEGEIKSDMASPAVGIPIAARSHV